MREDDGPWGEEEEDEQDKKRMAWEDKQGEQPEARESAAPLPSFSPHLSLLMLLLHLSLVKINI